MAQRHNGTIKWFDAKKGFGFITAGVGGPDIFVHGSEAEKNGLDVEDLKPDVAVTYEIGVDRSGRNKAINVLTA